MAARRFHQDHRRGCQVLAVSGTEGVAAMFMVATLPSLSSVIVAARLSRTFLSGLLFPPPIFRELGVGE